MDPSTGFSLLDCLDLWSLRHSLVLSAVGQLAVRTLQRRGNFVHKATSTWCQQNGWRGGTHGKPLGNSLFQVDCHIGWFRVEKLHFGQLGWGFCLPQYPHCCSSRRRSNEPFQQFGLQKCSWLAGMGGGDIRLQDPGACEVEIWYIPKWRFPKMGVFKMDGL